MGGVCWTKVWRVTCWEILGLYKNGWKYHLFPSLPLCYTIPLIIHYLNNLLVMRSSTDSPPFEQYSNGMVANRPVLGIDTDRVLAEENLPHPSLQVGSTLEMGFVKDVVYGHDIKLVALNMEVETLRH